MELESVFEEARSWPKLYFISCKNNVSWVSRVFLAKYGLLGCCAPVSQRETRAPLSQVEIQAYLCGTLAVLKAFPQRSMRLRPWSVVSRTLHPGQRRAHPEPSRLACAVDGIHRSAHGVNLVLRFPMQ